MSARWLQSSCEESCVSLVRTKLNFWAILVVLMHMISAYQLTKISYKYYNICAIFFSQFAA